MANQAASIASIAADILAAGILEARLVYIGTARVEANLAAGFLSGAESGTHYIVSTERGANDAAAMLEAAGEDVTVDPYYFCIGSNPRRFEVTVW